MAAKIKSFFGLREVLILGSILAVIFLRSQSILVKLQPTEELVGGNFLCESRTSVLSAGTKSWTVPGSQSPALLVEFLRKATVSDKFAIPGKGAPVVNLARGKKTAFGDALAVHVVSVDKTASDQPLLQVKILNKAHKGEFWYIAASSVNPSAKVDDPEK